MHAERRIKGIADSRLGPRPYGVLEKVHTADVSYHINCRVRIAGLVIVSGAADSAFRYGLET